DRAQQLPRNAVAPADDSHPDVVGYTAIGLGNQVAPEQAHEKGDFARGARPVIGGKGVKREHADSTVGSGFDVIEHNTHDRDVASGARTAASVFPAPVVVHDDCDMDARLRGRLLW